MLTRYGMCPGIKSGENEVSAELRQRNYYGNYRVVRAFFPQTLMGQENSSARAARQIIQEMNPDEDLVVSCKTVGAEFQARVAELRSHRTGTGRTRIIIHHEPEGDLTVAAYNTKWDTALPTLVNEAGWLEPGTCHTGFWSQRVDEDGVRLNDWRQWIPANPAVQTLLRFVSADLYPAAQWPTKAKPDYYEPPLPHIDLDGNQSIGFCGILDEMITELRSSAWPNIRADLEGGIAELNHERANTASGWNFTDANGTGCAAWLNDVLQYAWNRYSFVTYFHKGGGILTDRSPQTEAEMLRAWLQSTYDETPAEEPDPQDIQYGYGWEARAALALEEVTQARVEGIAEGKRMLATAINRVLDEQSPTVSS